MESWYDEGSVASCLIPYQISTDLATIQYGFICVVTGATQALGRAITYELAGTRAILDR